jgi:hypothetical protein
MEDSLSEEFPSFSRLAMRKPNSAFLMTVHSISYLPSGIEASWAEHLFVYQAGFHCAVLLIEADITPSKIWATTTCVPCLNKTISIHDISICSYKKIALKVASTVFRACDLCISGVAIVSCGVAHFVRGGA